jgi:hypothetical protein
MAWTYKKGVGLCKKFDFFFSIFNLNCKLNIFTIFLTKKDTKYKTLCPFGIVIAR